MNQFKHYLVFFILCHRPVLFAQDEPQSNIYTVKNFETNKPIANVHIRNSDDRIISYTNESGKFMLKNPRFRRSLLKLSCVGYQTLFIDFSKLKTNEVKMIEDTTFLKEVVIEPISAKQLVVKCIESLEKNYLANQIKGKGSIKIGVPNDSELSSACELEFQVKREGRYDIYNTDCHLGADTSTTEIFDLVDYAFQFDHIINGRGFLNYANIDSWRFKFKREVYYNEDTLRVVTAKYIVGTNGKNMVDHYGIIYINERDYSIPKIEYHYEWIKTKPRRTSDNSWFSDRKWYGYAYYANRGKKYEILNLKFDLQRDFYKNSNVLSKIDSKNFFVEYRSTLD
ncbi:MAG: carboxypeptidase-like regulatory domain-containing protein [Bacteroidota bacterium]